MFPSDGVQIQSLKGGDIAEPMESRINPDHVPFHVQITPYIPSEIISQLMCISPVSNSKVIGLILSVCLSSPVAGNERCDVTAWK